MSESERILWRAQRIMANGKARSWSHALQLAAESIKREPTTTTRTGSSQ